MTNAWRTERLPEIVRAMAGRPRHEALRVHVTELLREGFGAPYAEIGHEVYLLDGTGRIDTLWGATVIELKSDLRREIDDVRARLPAYLADAAARSPSPRPVTGLATDGATFIAYTLRDGALHELARHATNPAAPDELMAWLEPLLTDRPDLLPTPRAVVQAFGRASLTFGRARMALDALWAALQHDPEVRLKRDLWDGLLREAYGEQVGEDALFLQHTYLIIVVKAIAARVLDLPVDDPAALLSGRALADEGILGAVEADFFDWPLRLPAGADLVREVAQGAARFRLRDVETDVLKILYESLIDPDQRHDLGEYYTPDWLAARVVAAAVDAPLTQRVLDPACGSGTFLFHAVRRLVAAGQAAGWPGPRILEACADQVRGLDVHPVAVTLARVTWLLALGELVGDRPAKLTVPVFLGDAMQWNLRRTLDSADVLVEVPGGAPLQIPAGFAEDQAVFEQGLDALNQGLQDDAAPEAVGRALRRIQGAAPADADALAETFRALQALYRAGRNGIWTFVFRNLVRPVWLSRPEQRADVLVGNPPWIVYRHLIPGALSVDCSDPGSMRDGGEALGRVHPLVPSAAAGIHDGVVAVPDPMAEEGGAQAGPHGSNRVQFRRVGRRRKQADVPRHAQLARGVPAGLAGRGDGMRPFGRLAADFGQVHGHGVRVGVRQHDGSPPRRAPDRRRRTGRPGCGDGRAAHAGASRGAHTRVSVPCWPTRRNAGRLRLGLRP